jgi:hypothetical protein
MLDDRIHANVASIYLITIRLIQQKVAGVLNELQVAPGHLADSRVRDAAGQRGAKIRFPFFDAVEINNPLHKEARPNQFSSRRAGSV